MERRLAMPCSMLVEVECQTAPLSDLVPFDGARVVVCTKHTGSSGDVGEEAWTKCRVVRASQGRGSWG